jgi:hypothetical protein
MTTMTKKKILDMVGFTMILAHNNELEGVLTEDEMELMMKTLKEKFNNDEEAVIFYLKQKVKAYAKDLVSS